MIYDDILGTIGRTPVVRINKLAPAGMTMYVKLEAFNPMSSVKDRLALGIILDAEARGELKPGQMVVEATSGNTGMALAMVCAVRGYPFVAFMADSFSIERRKLMRALGAKVILTPAAERATGMVKRAEEFAEKHGAFLTRQFDNPANPAYHRATTGPEILQDFAGKRLDWWVTGYGTGGTLTGAGEMLQAGASGPEDRGDRADRRGNAVRRRMEAAQDPGLDARLRRADLNREIYDRIVLVDDVYARDTARTWPHSEGIFCGVSGGGTFAAALEVAETLEPGSVMLAMMPDTGERYL